MNCATHPETSAVAFCRNCGRAICEACQREWQQAPHCEQCVANLEAAVSPVSGAPQGSDEASSSRPETQASAEQRPASVHTRTDSAPAPVRGPGSPALATLLGLVPGVGAVYNGQYAKGVVHAVLWGGLIGVASSGGEPPPVFVILVILLTFYMPIEAYRTARALRRGEEVDEFSGLLSFGSPTSRSPAGGIVLIVVGVLFLLNSLGFWQLRQLSRYWPVILIATGVYMLYRRMTENPGTRDDSRFTPTGTTANPRGSHPDARAFPGSEQGAPSETTSAAPPSFHQGHRTEGDSP